MKNMLKNKNTRTDLLTYAIVIVAFVIMQTMNSGNMLGSSIKGFLIPICAYISLAVSLNLLVGVCGELSLGHAGFMGIGAFTGIVISAVLKDVVDSDVLRLDEHLDLFLPSYIRLLLFLKVNTRLDKHRHKVCGKSYSLLS